MRAPPGETDDHLAPVATPGEAPSAALLQAEEQRTALRAAKAQLEATVRERFAAASAKGDHKGTVRFAKLCAPPVVSFLTYLYLWPTAASAHAPVVGALEQLVALIVGWVSVTAIHIGKSLFTIQRFAKHLFGPSAMWTACQTGRVSDCSIGSGGAIADSRLWVWQRRGCGRSAATCEA